MFDERLRWISAGNFEGSPPNRSELPGSFCRSPLRGKMAT
jgi:hypothetical protein